MKITSQQRKALEAAGYTVGKSGSTIQKDGKTVGGYNANGQMFSGSGKIRDILKAKPEAAPKAAPAPRATRSTQSAPARSGVRGGRGDGNYERVVRGADAAIRRATSDKPPSVMSTAPRQPTPPKSQPQITRAGSKPTTPKPTTPKKDGANPPRTPARNPLNNPVSRGASGLGRRIGELLNGKPSRKPTKLDPKANKHPLD